MLITIGWFSILSAQLITKARIENIKTEIIDEKIKVNFSVINTAKDEKVKVELKFQSGDQFIYPKSFTGQTDSLSAGYYSIIWDVLKDVEQLEGDIIPMVEIIGTTIKLKAPSAFAPGFNSKFKILATVSYACIITGAYQLYSSNKNYENYKNELDNSGARKDYYDKAVSAKSTSVILIGAGVGLLATNVLLAKIYKNKYNLASIHYNNGGLFLSYVHTIH